jgi:hypothetical protein
VVTAVAAGKAVSVQLRLAAGLWEKALEPEDRAPYQDTLQLVARAEVRCAAPVQDPRPRYWTDSFITGLMGERPKVAEPEPEEPEPRVAVKGAADPGEGDSEAATPTSAPAGKTPSTAAKAMSTPAAAATSSAERAAARAARRERRKNATPEVDLNLHPPKPAAGEDPASDEAEE